jgi:hypothetical protein
MFAIVLLATGIGAESDGCLEFELPVRTVSVTNVSSDVVAVCEVPS